MNQFMKDLREEILRCGKVDKDLLDYIDDRVRDIVSDKLSQCMGDLLAQVGEKVHDQITKSYNRRAE